MLRTETTMQAAVASPCTTASAMRAADPRGWPLDRTAAPRMTAAATSATPIGTPFRRLQDPSGPLMVRASVRASALPGLATWARRPRREPADEREQKGGVD